MEEKKEITLSVAEAVAAELDRAIIKLLLLSPEEVARTAEAIRGIQHSALREGKDGKSPYSFTSRWFRVNMLRRTAEWLEEQRTRQQDVPKIDEEIKL